jgi:hypothetical protein
MPYFFIFIPDTALRQQLKLLKRAAQPVSAFYNGFVKPFMSA